MSGAEEPTFAGVLAAHMFPADCGSTDRGHMHVCHCTALHRLAPGYLCMRVCISDWCRST